MRHVDLTPLMRATVGFDRMMNLLDSAGRFDDATVGYPPYNIEKTGEDTYRTRPSATAGVPRYRFLEYERV